jgi:predicted DNA-binding transcriptional regulator YafY
MTDNSVYILYRNYKGAVAWRHIVPNNVVFESSAFHPVAQWLLVALDKDKQAHRSFAIADILKWRTEPPSSSFFSFLESTQT